MILLQSFISGTSYQVRILPKQTFEKLQRYNLIKKGIIWNYTTNGKRKFADVITKN